MIDDTDIGIAFGLVLLLLIITAVSSFATAMHTKGVKTQLDRIEREGCTHGESSIIAEMRNGKLYATQPTVTGCQP